MVGRTEAEPQYRGPGMWRMEAIDAIDNIEDIEDIEDRRTIDNQSRKTMKEKIKNEMLKCVITVALLLVLGWFALSASWSADEMSLLEKLAGFVYSLVVVPLYYVLKRVLRLS